MKILQSTIERGLYILLMIMFIFVAIGASYAVGTYRKLTTQQQQFHSGNVANLQTIEKNQVAQTQAIKVYIDCLLKIDPHGNVSTQEKVCFNKAPGIK